MGRAIGKTTDAAVLAHIAKEGTNPFERALAVNKLTDIRVLTEIAWTDNDPLVVVADRGCHREAAR